MKKLLFLLVFLFIPLAGLKAPTRNELIIFQFEPIVVKPIDLFIDHLAFKESSNNWLAINQQGYFGLFQFHEKTLKRIGYNITLADFKADNSIFPPELQRQCLKLLIEVNKIDLKPYYKYIGKRINGTRITLAGLLAACHLGGIVAVRLYLESNGAVDKADFHGTKISDYIREFNLYRV